MIGSSETTNRDSNFAREKCKFVLIVKPFLGVNLGQKFGNFHNNIARMA